ncbi:transcription termination/antitermination protein NusA [Streptomyces sp. NBC_00273]|uniref:transcription termination/antitermination protein NusA n=1 Tax=Streptomyces sp. NBC_00273 TaxID=2903644 RepID=UPI002E2D2F0C|nr:transcription termination/antitermination protein NusA [Streptomyces sp. NBC_00273]
MNGSLLRRSWDALLGPAPESAKRHVEGYSLWRRVVAGLFDYPLPPHAETDQPAAFPASLIKAAEPPKPRNQVARLATSTAEGHLPVAGSDPSFPNSVPQEGDLVAGVVESKDPNGVLVDIGTLVAILSTQEQADEKYTPGMHLQSYVVRVAKGTKGPAVWLSRSHPNLVKKLFALEVPEIADGSVEVASIAREAGHRTKIAVRSMRSGVDARGACIGPMGSRVRKVLVELHGEKIDVVDWSDDPAQMVANALSPAHVSKVEIIDVAARSALAIVPADHLQRAIGKEGVNYRLASRLTGGWRIELRPDTGEFRGR